MAEFKLGRIRFVFKGNWQPSQQYFKDDVVRHGGNTYVATEGHQSTNQFSNDNSKWSLISEGQSWQDDWSVSTLYRINDIVKYGGYLYIANTEHTSANTVNEGLEQDQEKWDLFAEGFDWKSDWQTESRYKINDIVKYGGNLYLCVSEHISSTEIDPATGGLEANQQDWEIFSAGLNWRDSWKSSTVYRVNDVVKYGGKIFVVNTSHKSADTDLLGLENDLSSYDILHSGFDFKGNWAGTFRYKENDVVSYGSSLFLCISDHTSQNLLEDDEEKWNLFVAGLEFEDSWSPFTNYNIGDVVTYGGYTYVAKTNHSNSKPTIDSTAWDLFNTGFRFAGIWGDDSSEEQYKVGDVVSLSGYTYLCIKDHEFGVRPPDAEFWAILNSGIKWQEAWQDQNFYNQGDAVRYADSSYLCVKSHTSDQTNVQNRPDQDLAGEFWNLLAASEEVNVLNTQGDLVYYSGSGPQRLPIGINGQVLSVNEAGDAPVWSFFGALNNVFYVDYARGQNLPAPAFGTTLDSPWKNLYYATYQIEKGALRANSIYLLETNRAFILNETLGWVDDQISSNTAPFDGFSYTLADWQLLIDLVLESLLYDISHGGNERTFEFLDNNYDQYNLPTDRNQFSATLDYIKNTLIPNILDNIAVSPTYSSFGQNRDLSLESESDTNTIQQSLISVIQTVIEAQDLSTRPKKDVSNDTIFVKTGKVEEILPISVPENTAIVGDELRSTRIEPTIETVDSSDATYMLSGITRLQSIISDIVQNQTVTKTSGNTEDPVDTGSVVGSASAATSATDLFQQIYDYIDYEVNGGTGDSTTPTFSGSNIKNSTTGFTYAAEAIEKNRQFLIEEAIVYINLLHSTPGIDETFYRQLFNRFVDSLKYDLVYTGNYQSLTAARVYSNSINGSTQENMFLMRNGTGLRNCTVAGLQGTLQTPNEFGTQRPNAGAFVSLDPGWGPADERVWIETRSPYVQNVSTFGNGCVGCKIDGDLHDGGNDSIVANDFTQIVSGGIGVWCTNLGRTELVSVFSYYAHIGYLAEAGGKIRATNGNSSYGDFGTVAEGVDSTEIPITGTVNNQSLEAIVQNIFTDGDRILTFEYLNAGVNYTSSQTTFSLTGEGFGASISGVNTTDGGVFEVRLLDTDDNFGGDGYITAQNTAQTGDTRSIFISNTDLRTGPQYIGMAIFLISGRGAGQYGMIAEYNSSTKLAEIADPAVGFRTVSGTVNPNVVTVNSTTDVEVGDIIRFTGTEFGNLSVGVEYTVESISGNDITLSQDGSSPNLTSGSGTMNLYVSTWRHVANLGLESILDDTSEYLIEPRLDFGSPVSGLYADTAKGRALVEDNQIVEIRIWDPGSGYTTAPSLDIVDPNSITDIPVEVRIGDGVLSQPSWDNRGTAYASADATVSGDGYADLYQPGKFLIVQNLSEIPEPGANLNLDSLPGQFFKLVTVRDLQGEGPYSAQLQISPELEISEAPEQGTGFTLRIRYSQVRLTGHDFLEIGTGNFENTNYPGDPFNDPDPTKETNDFDGGRVFYTSTDQNGNFRVGELFNVEQATGVASLNADAFNLAGLQELQLGALQLGGTTAVVTEFSTDGTFSANSDNIVPTQKAIRTYIQSQIGGGQGELNVNSVTAGDIRIIGNEILNTTGGTINIKADIEFQGGVSGAPAALGYFLSQ